MFPQTYNNASALKFIIASILLLFLPVHVGYPQTTPIDVDASTTFLSASLSDIILTILPGILVTGLALLIAIREHRRAKHLAYYLHQQRYCCAAAEHSDIGFWLTDQEGNTLYLNKTTRHLLGIGNDKVIQRNDNARFLKPLSPSPYQTCNQPQYYPALLCGPNNIEHTALIVEQTISDPDDQKSNLLILRTIIKQKMLP